MDFPISVPSIGLVDGKFADEDPLAGTPGSLIPAQWGNGVTLEIVNVIEAAGLEPSEFNNAQLLLAIRNIVRGAEIAVLTDTGVAGAYTAVNAIPLTAQPTTGFVQRVKIANPNAGASTYSPDGIAARPIYGLGLQPLQGGELPVGVAVLMYLVQAGVNGGNGAWIIIESLGGAQQVAPATKGQHAVQLGQIGQVQSARGLVGANNVTNPNTQYDVAADFLVLRNPTTGSLATIASTGTITCNISTAGPAANGRDQSAAFSASTWLHLYFIWNGTTLATVASLSSTGPTLPSGYTYWFYVGAVYLNSSSQLVKTRYRGPRAFYYSQLSVVSNGSATTQTAVSIATAVPPNAQTAQVSASGQLNCNSTGVAQSFVAVRVDTGLDAFAIPISSTTSGVGLSSGIQDVPNIGQNLYYLWYSETNPANISLRQAQLGIAGFTIVNGA